MHFIFLQKYVKVNILHIRSVEATTSITCNFVQYVNAAKGPRFSI